MKLNISQRIMEYITGQRKQQKILLAVIVISILVFASVPVFAQSANLEILWFSIDGGGSTSSSGGGYSLSGTIGQPDAGVISGGNFTVQGGFWNTDSANNLLEILLPVVVR